MLRVYGKSAAALTYLGDMAKGAFAVWIGRLIFAWAGAGPYGGYVGAYAALLGHIFFRCTSALKAAREWPRRWASCL
jgi:glycerol-3-phosphate acyltransferase PlsY